MPPPCFFSKTFRYLFSENSCGGPFACAKVARWGTEWGLNNRSKVMFWAFWVSFIGMVLHTYTFFSLSTDPQIIKSVHWVYAQVRVTSYIGDFDDAADISSKRTFYAGSRVLVSRCSASDDPVCDNEVEDWIDSTVCDDLGSYCPDCADVATSTVSMAFFGLVAMIPQILINLQRSTEAGDFNFQKWIGQAAAIVATVSTIISLIMCYTGCYEKLEDGLGAEGDDVKISVGSAYWSIVIATMLKPFDFWAHWVVPVPSVHWDPAHPEFWDEKHRLSDLGTRTKIKKSIILPMISQSMSASLEDVEKCLEEGGANCEGLQIAPILGGMPLAPSMMGMDTTESYSNKSNQGGSTAEAKTTTTAATASNRIVPTSPSSSSKTSSRKGTIPMKLKPGFHPNSSANIHAPQRVLSKYAMGVSQRDGTMLDCCEEGEMAVVEDVIGDDIDLKELLSSKNNNENDPNADCEDVSHMVGPDLCNGCDMEQQQPQEQQD